MEFAKKENWEKSKLEKFDIRKNDNYRKLKLEKI